MKRKCNFNLSGEHVTDRFFELTASPSPSMVILKLALPLYSLAPSVSELLSLRAEFGIELTEAAAKEARPEAAAMPCMEADRERVQ